MAVDKVTKTIKDKVTVNTKVKDMVKVMAMEVVMETTTVVGVVHTADNHTTTCLHKANKRQWLHLQDTRLTQCHQCLHQHLLLQRLRPHQLSKRSI